MKPIITLTLIWFVSIGSLQAQITNPRLTVKSTKIKDTVKVETLKIKPENTYVKKPSLPDLKLTAMNITLVRSELVEGVMKHTIQINYTVKNEGTVDIAANKVFTQGFIFLPGPNQRTIPGCGSVMSTLTWDNVPVGGSFSGSFRCTAAFDKSNPPLYRLHIDPDGLVKELNEENNMGQMTILF